MRVEARCPLSRRGWLEFPALRRAVHSKSRPAARSKTRHLFPAARHLIAAAAVQVAAARHYRLRTPGQDSACRLCHGVNKRLALRINKNGISPGSMGARSLRGIDGNLSRDITAVQQWRSHLSKLFVSDRDG